jgi:4-carboxymuconolactone decarboxylase
MALHNHSDANSFLALFDNIDQKFRRESLAQRLEMDTRTQALLSFAMVAAKLQTSWIPEHVRNCVDAGLGRTEIGEVLMQVYCYAGVYASLASFNAAAATLAELEAAGKLTSEQKAVANEPPPTQTVADRIAHGLQIRREIFGAENIESTLAKADDFINLFNEMTHDFCFGNIWGRPTFSRPMRSQLCLAIASATGQIGAVNRHVRSAVLGGVSRRRIAEIFMLTYVYGGAHHSYASFEMAREVFAQVESEAK